MPKFAVLMRENDDAWARTPAEEQGRLMEKYLAWVAELRSQGVFESGEPLDRGGRVLRAVDREVLEEPFTETKAVLTGFFIVQASDLAEATAIARGCPALGHGETVEVRPIGHS